MATRQFFNEVVIHCQPEDVFDYITDPRHWRDWFSSTLPPRIDIDGQAPGESFEITMERKTFRFAPLPLPYSMRCTISKSDRPYLWEVMADSEQVQTISSYTFSRSEEGTVCKRQFRYSTRGWMNYLEPLFLRRTIRSQARRNLEQIKRNVEQRCG